MKFSFFINGQNNILKFQFFNNDNNDNNDKNDSNNNITLYCSILLIDDVKQ